MPPTVHAAVLAKPPTLNLVHLPDELVDVILPVAQVTALDEVLEFPGAEAAGGVAELEGPEEVGDLLEVGADGVDLVDEVLHADDTVLAEVLLDDLIVGQGNALLVDLAITALYLIVSPDQDIRTNVAMLTVDELADGLLVGVTVGDVGFDDLQHLNGGLGQLDEDTVVDLEETEELESLALLGIDLVDTLDADDEGELRLGRDVEVAALLGLAGQPDLLLLGIAVLLYILLSASEDGLPLLLVLLCSTISQCSTAIDSAMLLREGDFISPERWLTNDSIDP